MSETVQHTSVPASEEVPDRVASADQVAAKPETTEGTGEASSHHSEYDTASETASDEEDEYDEDDEDYSGSQEIEEERRQGDGQDLDDDGERKKVDHDEDRSNPQYIPKKGNFYEHDDRTAEEAGLEGAPTEANESIVAAEDQSNTVADPTKKGEKPCGRAAVDRWSHDKFNEHDQAPKSRSELVSTYGYDIRNEDGPPRARRRRRYIKGPNHYDRNWEDEAAYMKPRKPKPEDFPALGARRPKRIEHRSDSNSGKPDQTVTQRDRRDNRVKPNRDNRQRRDNRNDEPFDRRTDDRRDRRIDDRRPGSGYRDSGNLEFRNQSRNKPQDNRESSSRVGGVANRNSFKSTSTMSQESSSRQEPNKDCDDNQHIETVSFSNTKLTPTQNRVVEQIDSRPYTEVPPANTSGRVIPPNQNPMSQMANVVPTMPPSVTDASSKPKRYSKRQRNVEGPGYVEGNPEENPMMHEKLIQHPMVQDWPAMAQQGPQHMVPPQQNIYQTVPPANMMNPMKPAPRNPNPAFTQPPYYNPEMGQPQGPRPGGPGPVQNLGQIGPLAYDPSMGQIITVQGQPMITNLGQQMGQQPAGCYAPYNQNYQSFNAMPGVTYYSPQPQQPRPVLQRRPMNPIPIVAPPDRAVPLDSAEHIDSILENMFTQRPPQHPELEPSYSAQTTQTDDSPTESTQQINNPSSQTDDPNKSLEEATQTAVEVVSEMVNKIDLKESNADGDNAPKSTDANESNA